MIRIGSRGSQLALWQANHIAKLLKDQGHKVEIEIIRTTGDRLQSLTFAEVGTVVSKGIFTLEIEQALEAGKIDLAVHSLKDLPTEIAEPFALGAIPVRADARDVLVSKDFVSFDSLPPGVRIGTSSLRRQSQLRHVRPDLEYVEFRGNVDTRLRKLAEGQASAIILAAAGLDRLEKTEWIRERIAPEVMCPAAGQGALGIEIRKGDQQVAETIAFMDDPSTRFRVTAERVALHALGGGCQVPIGVHCRSLNLDGMEVVNSPYEIIGVVADPSGIRIVHSRATGENAIELGHALAADLLKKGASELLQGIGIH